MRKKLFINYIIISVLMIIIVFVMSIKIVFGGNPKKTNDDNKIKVKIENVRYYNINTATPFWVNETKIGVIITETERYKAGDSVYIKVY